MHAVETRLAELGIILPDAPTPVANYVPYVISGNMVYVSGQISQHGGTLIRGRLGETLDVAEGAQAARSCAVNLLSQVSKACDGDWSRLKRVVKLTGFVSSTPGFTDQPKVINGASDLMVEIFGDAGRHARSAISAASLPSGAAVEIEAIFELT